MTCVTILSERISILGTTLQTVLSSMLCDMKLIVVDTTGLCIVLCKCGGTR